MQYEEKFKVEGCIMTKLKIWDQIVEKLKIRGPKWYLLSKKLANKINLQVWSNESYNINVCYMD